MVGSKRGGGKRRKLHENVAFLHSADRDVTTDSSLDLNAKGLSAGPLPTSRGQRGGIQLCLRKKEKALWQHSGSSVSRAQD